MGQEIRKGLTHAETVVKQLEELAIAKGVYGDESFYKKVRQEMAKQLLLFTPSIYPAEASRAVVATPGNNWSQGRYNVRFQPLV